MISAFSGFALIGGIVLVGWMLRRWGRLPEHAEAVLGRVSYLALAPCLLFQGVAAADLGLLFSEPLLVSTAAALLCFAIFAVAFRRLERPARVLGAMAGGYTNAGNIGIPVATYVLGDATLVVPIIVLQTLFLMPLAIILLEIGLTGRAEWRAVLTAPLRNPMTIGVLLGLVANLTGTGLPGVLGDLVSTIGAAAVPVVLIAFGMSLSGGRVLGAGPDRRPALASVILKVAAMPALAFLLGTALGLTHDQVYAVTVLAALPAAQNVFLLAQRSGAALILVRDAVFASTVACVPVLLLISALFTSVSSP
ncbi:AEC family transporter [Actinoplanes sp. RD1]|uniref:AEC family transporter n=1 Tax=Actinoplanes sp. RD1 TaxID=3064538 RepID=UPI002742631F|nr:AEC family transporter [Actinoplanes sp. RD1]